MYKTGIALIYLSVAIRALVEQSTSSYFGLVAILLLTYGGLLFGEQTLKRRLDAGMGRFQQRFQAAYLIVEMCLLIGLQVVPPSNDYPVLLFIPLSLQAVLFFRQRTGFYWITVFTLVMVFLLTWDVDSVIQGLVMALLFGGICYLVGSYAHMIRKAETARRENQRTIEELRVAHHRLQSYAAQRQELAAAKERVHFARELHDSVTQTVFSMNLAAQTALVLWPGDPVRLDAQFDRFLELANDAMQQIQTLVAHLGSQRVAVSGFVPAIEQLIAERKTLDGLDVTIEVLGEMNLPEEVTAGLFRIVQEALTNITKHAGTQQAVVRLDLAGNPRYVEIEDQGIGFDLANSQDLPGHIGLSEMRERAEEIGWALSIDTRPGFGTHVRVENTIDGE
jgi:signal transduction histidine kinase